MSSVNETAEEGVFFDRILDFIKLKRGVDFSGYRKSLLKRRVQVRIRATKREDFQHYFIFLKRNHDEIDLLMQALTINVTSFFRDEFVFDVIENRVISDLVSSKEKKENKKLHVWSCGCSSGEEAYSFLMLLNQCLGSEMSQYRLKIIGTDIDLGALKKAKEAVYSFSDIEQLSETRCQLFDKYTCFYNKDKFQFKKEWSKFISYQYHDMIEDSPIKKMDVIFCRNVFIYFDRDLQKKLITKFYEALNPNGFLVLGTVESLTGQCDRFIEYDVKARIYQKNEEQL